MSDRPTPVDDAMSDPSASPSRPSQTSSPEAAGPPSRHKHKASKPSRKGPLAWMASNPVAANLLMFVLVIGGLMSSCSIKQEIFPEFEMEIVVVSIAYPGASPAEVEQGVVLAAEESIRQIEGVKEMRSTASEGYATIVVELLSGSDPNRGLQDVKSAVDRVTSFPVEIERPVVSLAVNRYEVVSLVVYGDQDERVLREQAERIRDELLADDRITVVDLFGVKPLEISVEVPQAELRRYGLTLEQVSQIVRANSVEVPGGGVKTASGEVLVRTNERRTTGPEFEDIPLVSRPDGTQVRLRDIATVRDGFSETDQKAFYQGKRAVMVKVYRVGDETPLDISAAVKEYLAANEKALPAGVEQAIWGDFSEFYSDRIDLLMRNAVFGLVLVVFVLGLFLEIRLAFWVTLGIPISFLGSMLFLPMVDASINMISLFAFIVTLGIVVDDAIVVGEAVHKRRSEGQAPIDAAIGGVREVAMPVSFAIMTTVVAFAPMLFVPGPPGKFFRLVPIVVIAVICISWVESLFVLPAHLSHSKAASSKGPLGFLHRGQQRFSQFVERMIDVTYVPVLVHAVRRRYLTLCASLAIFFVTLGLIIGGHVDFNFLPKTEGDIVVASLQMPFGVDARETERYTQQVVRAGREVLAELGGEAKTSRGVFSQTGAAGTFEGGMNGPAGSGGSHLSEVAFFLVPLSERNFTSKEFSSKWRERVGQIPGMEKLKFVYSNGAQAGAAVHIELSHRDIHVLEAASSDLAAKIGENVGVIDIDDGFQAGKPQLDFRLKSEARSLGMTTSDVARQVRSSFFGSEAARFQRGRDEVRVYVRLPRDERRSEYNIESLMLRTSAGGELPLWAAAEVDRGSAYTAINRTDGRRVVNVTADVEEGVTTGTKVTEEIVQNVLPDLLKRYPGLTYTLGGEQKSQQETLTSLGKGFLFALFGIFALLAMAFRSYVQPLIIMSVIPFGLVGAVLGHIAMGYEMSLMSMMGVVALSGVVVNDSLILIAAINEFRAGGSEDFQGIIDGGARRFRPIILTSLTTFFGLIPMIAETSAQARFMIPMAISLGFGVLFATVLTLVLVPALYQIVLDAKRFFTWVFSSDEALQPGE